MTESCSLDVPYDERRGIQYFESKRRSRHRQTSQRISLNRIIRREQASCSLHCPKPAAYRFLGSNLSTRVDGYSTVAFLDQHDIVLGANPHGRIDILRLPSGPSDEVSGTKLAECIDLGHVQEQKCTLQLKSIENGKSFAVGFPTGEFRVFATELSTSWSNGPYRSRQRQVSQSSHREAGWNLEGYSFLPPKRRYYRDVDTGAHTLQRMFKHHGNEKMLPSCTMLQINDWNAKEAWWRTQQSNPVSWYDEHDARWDFRETTSGLLAAYVDLERDCFSLRVMDNRTQHSVRPSVFIDMTSKDCLPDLREDVTSTCFVSDHYLLTSHVTTLAQESARTLNSSLKLWDIRMSSRGDRPVIERMFTSFPLDPVVGGEPEQVRDISKMVSGSGEEEQQYSYSNAAITRLTSSQKAAGTIVVSLQMSHPVPCYERLIFDPITGDILYHNRSSKSSLYAVSPTHDFSACYQAGVRACDSTLSFYDTTIPTNGSKRKQAAKNMKRKRDDEVVADCPNGGLTGEIPVHIEDRDGIPTWISSIAFNDTGTALVGGSMDGDMFVWRGG